MANQKQELLVVAMFVNGSGQKVQSLERTFHRCFLPSFSSLGRGVSEENIKIWKDNGRLTTDVKWWPKLTLPLARWAEKNATQHKTQKTLKNKKANSKFNYVKRNLINTFNCKYLTYLYPIKNKIYKD